MIFTDAMTREPLKSLGPKCSIRSIRLIRLIRLSTFALLLSSCANIEHPNHELKVIQASDLNLPLSSTPEIGPAWWERLENKDLSNLIESSLQNNPSIALANTRIDKALALVGVTRSASSVQLGAGFDLDRQRFSQTGIYPPPLGGSMQSVSTLQLSGSWVPDVFGKNKAALSSAMGQAQASALEAMHAKAQLSAQMTLQFIALALSIDQRDVLLQRKTKLESLRHLLSERVKVGLDASLDIKTQDIELNDLLIELSQLQVQIELHQHLLATLGARSPVALSSLTPHLRDLRTVDLNANLGIDLLGHRADVMAAKYRVFAALESVEAAKLDFYPNFNLGLFAGFNSLHLNQLTQNSSAQYGVVPSLTLPLLNGGRLNAQLSAKAAEKDQAVALYNSTLLDALQEASDALVTYKNTKIQVTSSQRSLLVSTEKLNIQRLKAQAGLSNDIVVLRESLAELQQQRLSLEWAAKQLSSLVLLIKSLGAGWPTPDPRSNAFAQRP